MKVEHKTSRELVAVIAAHGNGLFVGDARNSDSSCFINSAGESVFITKSLSEILHEEPDTRRAVYRGETITLTF